MSKDHMKLYYGAPEINELGIPLTSAIENLDVMLTVVGREQQKQDRALRNVKYCLYALAMLEIVQLVILAVK